MFHVFVKSQNIFHLLLFTSKHTIILLIYRLTILLKSVVYEDELHYYK